jgi:5'-3' exonuclease
MGIHNLNKILKKECGDMFETVSLKKYAYKKIAIDTSLYMYKYKVIFNDGWLRAFTNLVCCLRKNDVHPIFIFDSKAPIEKLEEQQNRRKEREKLKTKLQNIEHDYQIYKDDGKVSELLQEISSSDKKHPQLLIKNIFNENSIINKINTLRNQTISIDKEDFTTLKKLLTVMKIPFYDATSEAEGTCSYLNIKNKVSAVLTEDTDVLAYGAPVFLSNLNTHNETFTQVKIKDLLNGLELTQPQFTDMCIMCGTDYNKNIPKVGPIKSYGLIYEHKTIENIEQNTKHDISILKHIRSRELFSFSNNYFTPKLKYCGIPNINQINKFLLKHNCKIDLSYITKCIGHKEIILK